jgi:hypothetical protein
MKTLFSSLVLLISLIGLAWTCGFDFPVAVFSYHRHPDLPRNRFLEGQLGVLERTYARSYLIVAYRYLSGVGLTPGEREQVRLYWNDRESGDWDGNEIKSAEQWLRMRQSLVGTAKGASALADDEGFKFLRDTYSWQLNCSDDAFKTAIQTLRDRSGRYGKTNPVVLDWLKGQDAVFRNCGSPAAKSIPKPLPLGAPAWLKADREYQQAAAHFYSDDLRTAEVEFQQISADSISPWRWIAPYLVARVLERAAESFDTTKPPTAEEDANYKKLEIQVTRVLGDRKLAPIHGMTRALFRRIREQVQPQVEISELAKIVMERREEGSLRQDLWDYTTLLNHFLDQPYAYQKDALAAFEKEAATLPRQDDITDWLVTFQSQKPQDAAHAIRRWQQTRSLPWLVAALSRAGGSDPSASALIEASLAIGAESPAYWTAVFHRNRLRIEGGDKTAARSELDASIDNTSKTLPKSAANHFRSLRMLTSPDLENFLKFAQRLPVMVTNQMNDGETPKSFYPNPYPEISAKLPRWDRDSIKILNERAPLAVWKSAAVDANLAPHLHQELALSAFARATLLNEDQTLQQLAPSVGESFAEGRKYIASLAAEPTAEGRHFAAAFFLLHYANVRPYLTSGVTWQVPFSPTLEKSVMDSYVNSWWCALDSPYELDWDATKFMQEYKAVRRSDSDAAAARAAFLQPEDIAIGKNEFARLAATGNAPDYLLRQTLEWARQHPADPRVAESLAYAVRTGKYGCASAKTAGLSQEAFALLHSTYGHSPWAAKTPFWFRTWYPQERP